MRRYCNDRDTDGRVVDPDPEQRLAVVRTASGEVVLPWTLMVAEVVGCE